MQRKMKCSDLEGDRGRQRQIEPKQQMAQIFLDYQSNTDGESVKSCKNSSSTTCGSIGRKGTSSILRKLRYRTGKLKTNISCITNENKGSSESNVQKVDIVVSEDSTSCDDPGQSHNKNKTLSQSQNFTSISNLRNVNKTEKHKRKKGFSCEVCDHVASSSQRLKEHLSRHSGIKHLECGICGKKFAWRYSLKSHMASHMENNPNKCTICGKKYCNKSSVKNHIVRVHGNPDKNFKCVKCEKTFMTKSELDRHSFNHSKEKPFVCEYCGNSYRFKGALSVHYRVHSKEIPYKCEFCEKEFLHLSSMIGHRRRHTGEKPFQCKDCGKMFHIKRAMTSHMTVHSKEGKFKCDECGKIFKSRSGYQVHLDYHMGIKRHACKHCGKTFRAWCNMHKHMRRHLGDKPHKCEICGKNFIEKQELKNHMKSHTDIGQKQKKIPIMHNIIASCSEIISPPSLTSTSCNIETSVFGNSQHTDMISHIDMTDNQVIYDCNIPNAIDKCSTDKCQLLQDNYVSQFLYSQHPPVQYVPQSVSMQNIYNNIDSDQSTQRTACLANINTTNYNCVQLNSQNFNSFSFNLPSDELVSKCKLCRSLFHSTLVLRSHLLDYHRIDEENVDELLT